MKTQWRKWSLLAVLIILLLVQPGQAAEIVEVEMNGLPVEFDTPAVISNDRVMVPFRGLAELLDVQVEWLADSQTVMAVAPGTQIKLQVGNPIAYHNQEPVSLDAPLCSPREEFWCRCAFSVRPLAAR